MSRRVILYVLLCGFVFMGATSDQKKDKRPNIILILADDLGYETIAANGGESYQTPNIDRLASEGMRFEHCYAQPQCTQSRVQFLTGIYNVRNYVNFGTLHTSQITMAQQLKKAGYTTGIVGKWQLGKNPDNVTQLGFDDYFVWQLTEPRADPDGRDNRFSAPLLDRNGEVIRFGADEYGPKLINDHSLGFIEKASKGDKPFFLFYSMMLTHCPFSPTPDSPEWASDRSSVMTYKGDAKYFGDMVAYMDKMVGNIDAKLRELGIDKNTIVIFTGDNGTDQPIVSKLNGQDAAGGKLQSTDAGTRVPLIVKWPGSVKRGTVNNNLVDFTDFMPTVLEAASAEIPRSPELDGVSFLSQLKGSKKVTPRKWTYSWYLNPQKKEPRVYARTHQYKLYDTGEFYDVTIDQLEKQPLSVENLAPEVVAVHKELQSVIDGYSKRRLDAIPN